MLTKGPKSCFTLHKRMGYIGLCSRLGMSGSYRTNEVGVQGGGGIPSLIFFSEAFDKQTIKIFQLQ